MIRNGSDSPIGARGGVLDVSDAFQGLTQTVVYGRITKSVDQTTFELREQFIPASFEGVVQPLSPRQLELKPEGQRQWRWLMFHSRSDLELENDDVVYYQDVRYRVRATVPWGSYGYFEYHLCEDYQNRNVAPPLPEERDLLRYSVDVLALAAMSADLTVSDDAAIKNASQAVWVVYNLQNNARVPDAVQVLDEVTVRITVPAAGNYRLIGEG